MVYLSIYHIWDLSHISICLWECLCHNRFEYYWILLIYVWIIYEPCDLLKIDYKQIANRGVFLGISNIINASYLLYLSLIFNIWINCSYDQNLHGVRSYFNMGNYQSKNDWETNGLRMRGVLGELIMKTSEINGFVLRNFSPEQAWAVWATMGWYSVQAKWLDAELFRVWCKVRKSEPW